MAQFSVKIIRLTGSVLGENQQACFPELWPTREAAKKDGQRKGTNDYYRNLYNSEMSPSSAEVTYRPEGAGHRARTARVDLSRIPDPEAWLTNRLGPLAQCDIAAPLGEQATQHARLDGLVTRLTSSMQVVIATRRAALDALSARLEAVAPTSFSATTEPREENNS
jgi:putative DNA primase/helicase